MSDFIKDYWNSCKWVTSTTNQSLVNLWNHPNLHQAIQINFREKWTRIDKILYIWIWKRNKYDMEEVSKEFSTYCYLSPLRWITINCWNGFSCHIIRCTFNPSIPRKSLQDRIWIGITIDLGEIDGTWRRHHSINVSNFKPYGENIPEKLV